MSFCHIRIFFKKLFLGLHPWCGLPVGYPWFRVLIFSWPDDILQRTTNVQINRAWNKDIERKKEREIERKADISPAQITQALSGICVYCHSSSPFLLLGFWCRSLHLSKAGGGLGSPTELSWEGLGSWWCSGRGLTAAGQCFNMALLPAGQAHFLTSREVIAFSHLLSLLSLSINK